MSPRAAWRLETLGFTRVYDYVAGKADWFAAGLPREGKLASVPRAGDVARRDFPTCKLHERVGDVAGRMRDAGDDFCLVVTDGDVLLGRVRESVLDGDAEAHIEDVMQSGPSTVRPDTLLEDIAGRMRARKVKIMPITSPEGRLIGTLILQDALDRLEQVLGDQELEEKELEEKEVEEEGSCHCDL